jgi:hypothetical protein
VQGAEPSAVGPYTARTAVDEAFIVPEQVLAFIWSEIRSELILDHLQLATC